MATQWVLDKISDTLAPTVSNGVATAGSFAGGAISAVGNSINGVGDGISRSIRRYGDGVMDYGNGVMDWTKASGGRAQTASNPLGLSSGAPQGKTTVTSPSVYRAQPRSNASKTLMTTNKSAKKVEGGAPKKALPAPGTSVAGKKPAGTSLKKTETKAPVKKSGVNPTSNAPNPGAMRNSTNKPAVGSTTKKIAPVKPSTASVPKTSTVKPQTRKVNHTAAANPLGLSI